MQAPLHLLRSTLAALATLLAAGVAPAQTAPASNELPARLKGDQRLEHITVEDSGSRIDELRYGGQTESVHVQPKLPALPAYEVLSNDGARGRPGSPNDAGGPLGERVWNLLNF
ncbi:MAG: hypothetical protein JOY84_18735 [Curvibacter sp.]|nr:hypothetical protein [Curvibacter sp.]